MIAPKYCRYIIVVIVAIPIIINVVMYFNNPIERFVPVMGSFNDWIGFFGSYVGAIIGGMITLFVLNYTIRENIVIRATQVKTIKYTQQHTRLENLRRQLIDNYQMFDTQSINAAIFELQKESYDKALSILLSSNRNIEFQTHSSSLYFISETPTPEEVEYHKTVNRILVEYGTLINDLMFYCSVLQLRHSSTPITNQDIIDIAKRTYDYTITFSKYAPRFCDYYKENSILANVIRIKTDDANFEKLFMKAMQNLQTIGLQLHVRKYELMNKTENVLRAEERRINQILE